MSQTGLKLIKDLFTALGGHFAISPNQIEDALIKIRCFVFDWDGVFSAGRKGVNVTSTFAEADSMGINLFRYGYWLINHELPLFAIITGENNETAIKFAKREHLTAVYSKIPEKMKALEYICETEYVRLDQIACVYDDVNDLSMAQECGLRIKVRRDASPLFKRFCVEKSFCDYTTGHTGQEYAVREVCELFLGLIGKYEQVVKSRVAFDETYRSYWQVRNEIKPRYFIMRNGEIFEEKGHSDA